MAPQRAEFCLPQVIVSMCETYTVTLNRFLQKPKYKDWSKQLEYVSVFEGELNDEIVVVKIFTPSDGTDITSARAENEISALELLTEASCDFAPKLVADFHWLQLDIDMTPCYQFNQVVVMTRMPGRVVRSKMLRDPVMYRRIACAFHEALAAIHSVGVDNDSHHRSNALWNEDEGKCYIIDYERAKFEVDGTPQWEESDFVSWFGIPPPVLCIWHE